MKTALATFPTLCDARFPHLATFREADNLTIIDKGEIVDFPAGRLYSYLAGYPDIESAVVSLLVAMESIAGRGRRVTAQDVLFVTSTLWPLAADGESMIPSFRSYLRAQA